MLSKVISGGQTGADIGGVRAAHCRGVETGGNMTKGWKTLDGPRPEYGVEYGMVEMDTADYPTRTRANVKEACGTIRFATDFFSPGEICTKKAIDYYHRPYFDVLADENAWDLLPEAVGWIKRNKIEILNVAGNTEQSAPGMERFVFHFMLAIFDELGIVSKDVQQS
jgi:hypothetical protein